MVQTHSWQHLAVLLVESLTFFFFRSFSRLFGFLRWYIQINKTMSFEGPNGRPNEKGVIMHVDKQRGSFIVIKRVIYWIQMILDKVYTKGGGLLSGDVRVDLNGGGRISTDDMGRGRGVTEDIHSLLIIRLCRPIPVAFQIVDNVA